MCAPAADVALRPSISCLACASLRLGVCDCAALACVTLALWPPCSPPAPAADWPASAADSPPCACETPACSAWTTSASACPWFRPADLAASSADRLLHLLIHFRRFDLGQNLPRLDAGADVHVADAAQVAPGAGVDGRLFDRLHAAGQGQGGGRGQMSASTIIHDGRVRSDSILRPQRLICWFLRRRGSYTGCKQTYPIKIPTPPTTPTRNPAPRSRRRHGIVRVVVRMIEFVIFQARNVPLRFAMADSSLFHSCSRSSRPACEPSFLRFHILLS